MPGLGQKYEIDIETLSKPKEDYVTDEYFELDLVIYPQHVMFHAVPLLWRLHMVHHADLDYDLTTGLRFHPIEIVLSMILKLTVIVALAPPVIAVLVFEIVLNGMAMFNHGNIRLAPSLDRLFRFIIGIIGV
jgi:sterol desaturase/sphingolipid hydroxylase (fatty acid hydroxylase superfamily)